MRKKRGDKAVWMKDFERRMQPSHCIVHSPFQIREDLSTREYFQRKMQMARHQENSLNV